MSDTPPGAPGPDDRPPDRLERLRAAAARRPPPTGDPVADDVTAANLRDVFYRAARAKLAAALNLTRRPRE